MSNVNEATKNWIPTVIAFVMMCLAVGTTIGISSAKYARLEEQVHSLCTVAEKRESRIGALEMRQQLTDIQYTEIKKDLEYIKVEIMKLTKARE